MKGIGLLIDSLEPEHNRTICIAGASGFLGKATMDAFTKRGFNVIALTRLESKSIVRLHNEQVEEFKGTVDDWIEVIQNRNPQTVFSFDWEGVESGSRNDQALQNSNVIRIGQLAEASRLSGVANFISFGSQAEVQPSTDPILETVEDNPQSFYGEAKVKARNEIMDLLSGSKTRFLWGRIFTIYGPGDSRDSLVTQLVNAMLRNENFTLKQPNKKWSFLEVTDYLEAILLLHGDSTTAGIVNIGNPDSTKIGELAEEIATKFGTPQNIEKLQDLEDLENQMSWIPDTSALSRLSWKPQVELGVGIENVIRWWKQLPS